MKDKLTLLICEAYLREAKRVLNEEDFSDVQIITFPVQTFQSPKDWKEIIKVFQKIKAEDSNPYLIGGTCFAHLRNPPEELQNCGISKLSNCAYMFLNQTLVNHLFREGVHTLTPGWLVSWRDHITRGGFDQRTAQEFFGESIKKIVLLDTGVIEDIETQLQEFAEFVNRPFEALPVGLDHFRLYITNIVLEWRDRVQEAKFSSEINMRNRRLADYAMIFDLLDNITRITTEEKVIQNFFNILTMLFAPKNIIYLPIIEKNPGNLQVSTEITINRESLIKQIGDMKDSSLWNPSEQGFTLKIEYKRQTLGFLKINNIKFPEYREHYLNLIHFLNRIAALAISNARIYQDLEESKETLLEIDDLRKKFVSMVSHELRSPTTAIMLSASIILNHFDTVSKETLHKMANIISLNADALAELLEDLLIISKLDESRVELEWEKYDLSLIIQKVLEQMEPRLKEKEIKLTISIPEETHLYGDEKKIRQIFRIFIDNAIKYTKKMGSLKINVIDHYRGEYNVRDEDGMWIQFRDSGIGIHEKDLPRLFERFFRAADVAAIPGTGLGLSIANEFVKLHAGNISVDSEFGKGTTFSIFLPRLAEAPE